MYKMSGRAFVKFLWTGRAVSKHGLLQASRSSRVAGGSASTLPVVSTNLVSNAHLVLKGVLVEYLSAVSHLVIWPGDGPEIHRRD